jgi:hypothetical protein
MALAMEEHTTTKMLGQNNAIETLKREVEVLGDKTPSFLPRWLGSPLRL